MEFAKPLQLLSLLSEKCYCSSPLHQASIDRLSTEEANKDTFEITVIHKVTQFVVERRVLITSTCILG